MAKTQKAAGPRKEKHGNKETPFLTFTVEISDQVCTSTHSSYADASSNTHKGTNHVLMTFCKLLNHSATVSGYSFMSARTHRYIYISIYLCTYMRRGEEEILNPEFTCYMLCANYMLLAAALSE